MIDLYKWELKSGVSDVSNRETVEATAGRAPRRTSGLLYANHDT